MRSSSSLFHCYVIGSCAWWCSILWCCWFFLQAHMACLRTVPPPPFFELLSTSSSWVFIICSEHMTLSILLLHRPLDLMVRWSLVLPAMSILLNWMASPVVWLVSLVVPDCVLSALSILPLWWSVPPTLFLMPLWIDTTIWALTVPVCPGHCDSPVHESKSLPAWPLSACWHCFPHYIPLELLAPLECITDLWDGYSIPCEESYHIFNSSVVWHLCWCNVWCHCYGET